MKMFKMKKEEMFKRFSPKIIGVTVALGSMGIFGFNVYADENKELLFDKNTIEYGDENIDFNSLIKNENIIIKNVSGLNTKKLGKQNITFDYTKLNSKGEESGIILSSKYSFNIKDTQAPKINLKEKEIKINQGDAFDPKSNIVNITDPVDGNINDCTMETQSENGDAVNFNTNIPGKFNILVKSKDKNGNNAKEKFTVEIIEKQPEIKDANILNINTGKTSNTDGNKNGRYTRSINRNAIDGSILFRNPDLIYYTVNQIKNGQNYFAIPYEKVATVCFDLAVDYCDDLNLQNIRMRYNFDEGYGYYTDENFQMVKNSVLQTEAKINNYKNWIVSKLKCLNLSTDERTLINSINTAVKNAMTYELNNKPLYWVSETGRGQCYHYAMTFNNMCKAVGIKSEYYATKEHAWNYVTVDGKRYKFDVTWNDCGNTNSYSWMAA